MSDKIDAFLDATAQAELVRSGEVSPIDLVESAVARIEAINPDINAIIIPLFEKARTEARDTSGPFQGVPYAIKDLTVVSKGDLNTSSIAGVKAAAYRADHDSYFVQRMRGAGFALVGKANTPEMGIQATTEPLAWGQCRNPWDLARSVGGSSGGSAAAVAAGLVPVAHGNDGGGSVRMPASQCGVVGLKPTRGRISSGPMATDSDNMAGMAHEGLMARSVRDVAAMLDVVSGHRPGDPYCAPTPLRPFAREIGVEAARLRIGVLAHDPMGLFEVDPECAEGAHKVAKLLAGFGHDVSDAFPQTLRDGNWPLEFMKCVDVGIMREIDRYSALIGRPLTEADMEWPTWQFVQRGRAVSAGAYADGIESLRNRAREIESWWEDDGWDLLVTPTSGRKQPMLGEVKETRDHEPENAMPMLAFTVPYNVTGQPAISLPLHWSSEGLPLGVQLVAAFGREDLLFRLGSQLETALPWADRRPPIRS
jgi:Asp-tRNA(Asn)/Glu-tRNA(Gln) amidotransferase A subunit family amidase